MKLILQAIKALFRKIEASRTHWDTRRIVTKEYTFDGNIDGKETIQINESMLFVKIADTLPEVSSITSLSIVYTSIPEGLVDEYELSPIDDVWIEGGIYSFDGGAFYTSSGGEFEGVHIPSGLYFDYLIDNEYTSKLSITYNDGELKKLDKKYLPDEVIESIGIANNAKTTANNAQTTANSKMDANNPVGTGSFSMGRKAGSVIGDFSHAEGSSTTASGSYSHAEGVGTTASGNCSHAEGSNTTASGKWSHAEGNYTKASSQDQHVQGKYNIEDTTNIYADIIGNGQYGSSSNAATVDWSGNAWFAGDVYVGSTSGTNKDDGSKKLATEAYVDERACVLMSSTPNSTKKFKITVDDAGTLSAVEVTT